MAGSDAVTASSSAGAEAGGSILRRGGNAVDAAFGTALATCVADREVSRIWRNDHPMLRHWWRNVPARITAMPTDVKAVLSMIAIMVAAVLAYWSGSPIRPEYGTFVMITAIFMVLAMWIFRGGRQTGG